MIRAFVMISLCFFFFKNFFSFFLLQPVSLFFLAFPSHTDYCFPLLLAINTPQVFVHIHSTPTAPVFSRESPVISEVLSLSFPVFYVVCSALLFSSETLREMETGLCLPVLEQGKINCIPKGLSFTVFYCLWMYCRSGAEGKYWEINIK